MNYEADLTCGQKQSKSIKIWNEIVSKLLQQSVIFSPQKTGYYKMLLKTPSCHSRREAKALMVAPSDSALPTAFFFTRWQGCRIRFTFNKKCSHMWEEKLKRFILQLEGFAFHHFYCISLSIQFTDIAWRYN